MKKPLTLPAALMAGLFTLFAAGAVWKISETTFPYESSPPPPAKGIPTESV